MAQDQNGPQAAYIYPCIQDSSLNVTQFPQYAQYITDGSVSSDGFNMTMNVSPAETPDRLTARPRAGYVLHRRRLLGRSLPGGSQAYDYPRGADNQGNAYISGYIQISVVPLPPKVPSVVKHTRTSAVKVKKAGH